MNWSYIVVEELPAGVTTVTSTFPGVCCGATAVIDVAEFTTNDDADIPPNNTWVARLNPVPLMVTLVPPAVEPLLVVRLVTWGGVANVHWSAVDFAEVPAEVVTTTSTVPVKLLGAYARIDVAD